MGYSLNLDEVINRCRGELDRANNWHAQHQREGNLCRCTRPWPCEVRSQVAAYAAHWKARLDHHEETQAAMKAPTATLPEVPASFNDLLRPAPTARPATWLAHGQTRQSTGTYWPRWLRWLSQDAGCVCPKRNVWRAVYWMRPSRSPRRPTQSCFQKTSE